MCCSFDGSLHRRRNRVHKATAVISASFKENSEMTPQCHGTLWCYSPGHQGSTLCLWSWGGSFFLLAWLWLELSLLAKFSSWIFPHVDLGLHLLSFYCLKYIAALSRIKVSNLRSHYLHVHLFCPFPEAHSTLLCFLIALITGPATGTSVRVQS